MSIIKKLAGFFRSKTYQDNPGDVASRLIEDKILQSDHQKQGTTGGCRDVDLQNDPCSGMNESDRTGEKIVSISVNESAWPSRTYRQRIIENLTSHE